MTTATDPKRQPAWLVVEADTGAMDGMYDSPEWAKEAADALVARYGGSWLVLRLESIRPDSAQGIALPTDRAFHAFRRDANGRIGGKRGAAGASAPVLPAETPRFPAATVNWPRHVEAAAHALRCAIGLADMYGTPGSGCERYSVQAVKALRPLLPYALHPVDDGALIWLNRDYKPLGITRLFPWVDYLAFPSLAVNASDPAVTAVRSRIARPDDQVLYLFDDGCPPWAGRRHALRLLGIVEAALDAARPA